MSLYLPIPPEMRGNSISVHRTHEGTLGVIFVAWEVKTPPFGLLHETRSSHFARVFQVVINGTTVLSDYDLPLAAGGKQITQIESFTTTADVCGRITIKFTSGSLEAMLNGIEAVINGIEVLSLPTVALPLSSTSIRRINCGGDAIETWEADNSYAGGEGRTFAQAIDRTRGADPAPLAIYQSARIGDCSYTLEGFIAGADYTVRLHFAENELSDIFCFCFKYTLAGRAALTLNHSTTYPISAGDACVTSSYDDFHFSATSADDPWDFITLYVRGQDFRSYFDDIVMRFAPVMPLPPSHPVLRALCGLFTLLWHNPDIDKVTLEDKLFEFIKALLNAAPNEPVLSQQSRFAEVDAFLQRHYAEAISLDDLAHSLHMSPNSVRELFHRHIHIPPITYLIHIRLQHACQFLRETSLPIAEIANRCGYDDVNYFSRVFRKHYGVTATAYRQQAD